MKVEPSVNSKFGIDINTKKLIRVQKEVRGAISKKLKIVILFIFLRMSHHIVKVQSNLSDLAKIFEEYNDDFVNKDKYFSYTRFNHLCGKILQLREAHGGYYDNIFVDHKKFPLFNNEKYWDSLFLIAFNSQKISNMKNKTVSNKPQFILPELQKDDIKIHIKYEWKNECVSGFFKSDPLGLIPYFPLWNYDIHTLGNNVSNWYRFHPIPFFINSIENDKINSSFEKENTIFKTQMEQPITELTKEFLNKNIFEKYSLIYFFGMGNEKNQFVAMLLYMILCKENINHGQFVLNKLPNTIRMILENRCDITDEKLSSFSQDNDEKTYEIKICLMQTSDHVKKKAIEKLREIQNKMSDISKPQQYLDKLLSVPFGIYRQETIFEVLKVFLKTVQNFSDEMKFDFVPQNWYELNKFFHVSNEISILLKISKEDIVPLIRACKKVLGLKSLNYKKDGNKYTVTINKKNVNEITKSLKEYVNLASPDIQNCISSVVKSLLKRNNYNKLSSQWPHVVHSIEESQKMMNRILDSCLYGQDVAKQAIENIICEWITGDSQGYCFGFEGPPGVGKTTLAKEGLSKCLIDVNGKSRPFIFIALGGMSHGSTLEGYGYTYASATCGSIVNSLVQSKCMNPIIFFDELDKVSKTEHGQEITGILMHLTDPVQNSEFCDKYFEGVPLDLSKALFIFSYNDISKVDPILRERIHSIKFDSFSTLDKIQICRSFIIPSINKRLGMPSDAVSLNDEALNFIIETYTYESGVRKIKQMLIQIYREINKRLLSNKLELPIILTITDIQTDYLKNLPHKFTKKISSVSQIGLVNGLFAMNGGGGGIIQISAKTYQSLGNSSANFEVTGQLGDVMKESVKVARTAVWNILKDDSLTKHLELINSKKLDYHIHCSENGVPKDGPSAGLALFIVILSSIIKVPVKNNVAFTGEMDLAGNVGIIGGLSDKLRGAYMAGVKTVFCPYDNQSDVEKIDIVKEKWMTEIEVIYVKNVFDTYFFENVFVEPINIHIKPTLKTSKSCPSMNI
tara:strand:- start:2027 stop:5098 length:3072 start_codon:yes stop_codon:yes gene_type:complete